MWTAFWGFAIGGEHLQLQNWPGLHTRCLCHVSALCFRTGCSAPCVSAPLDRAPCVFARGVSVPNLPFNYVWCGNATCRNTRCGNERCRIERCGNAQCVKVDAEAHKWGNMTKLHGVKDGLLLDVRSAQSLLEVVSIST